ncbi:hypothetical protein ACS0TY_019176 [Phlomoides rotata]
MVAHNRGKREAPTGANALSVLGASACSRSGGRRTNDAIDPGPHSWSGRQEEGPTQRRERAHCAGCHPR